MRFDAIPIWALFAGTIVVVMLAVEVGYLLGHAAHRRSQDEKESPVSAIAGTVLGLAAFMLAFTFGIVWERYDARKGLVREEASAIRTAWQRSDFLGVGYQTGIAGSRRSMARPLLALSFALAFALIASLDRPDSGVLQVTQQPLIDLRDTMTAAAGRAERE